MKLEKLKVYPASSSGSSETLEVLHMGEWHTVEVDDITRHGDTDCYTFCYTVPLRVFDEASDRMVWVDADCTDEFVASFA